MNKAYRYIYLGMFLPMALIMTACTPYKEITDYQEQNGSVTVLYNGERLESVCFLGTYCILYHEYGVGGISCDFSQRCDVAPHYGE